MVRMETGTSRTALQPDTTERMVLLRRELGVTSFGINQLTLQPGQRGRIHLHTNQEEVYLVLEGTLTVLVEGEPHELAYGELLRVGPDVRRQIANYGRGRVTVLALGGSGEHVGRDARAFTDWDSESSGTPQEVPLPEDIGPEELRSA
jgi:mannose-6-phosphate isomerase-like protein (cupin superfamily)